MVCVNVFSSPGWSATASGSDAATGFPPFHGLTVCASDAEHAVAPWFLSLRLHDDLGGGDARGDLDGFNRRVVGEMHRHAVVDAGRPLEFLEVGAGGIEHGQRAGMRADADEQRVLVVPVDGAGEVEAARGEAARVFAELGAVEPDGGAELGLVDLEDGDGPCRRRAKRPAIPKVVSLLARIAGGVNPGGLRERFLLDAIVDEFLAVEQVHVLEGGLWRGWPVRERARCA